MKSDRRVGKKHKSLSLSMSLLYHVWVSIISVCLTTTTVPVTVTAIATIIATSDALATPSPARKNTEVSIVTGANGFIGREIVHQLILDVDNSASQQQRERGGETTAQKDIFCLVRSHRVEEEKRFWDNFVDDPDRYCQHNIRVLPYDMLDGGTSIKDALQDAYDGIANDDVCVYHVASVFGPTQDGVQTAKDNVQGTVDLMNILSNFPGCRLVLTSSMAAVRGSGQAPGNGSYYTYKDWNTVSQLDESNWGSCYQWSKTESERVAWQLSKQFGIPMTSICPSFVFGPPTGTLSSTKHQSKKDRERMNLSSSYSITLVRQWMNGDSPVQSRLCVDIRDVARAHIAAGQKLKLKVDDVGLTMTNNGGQHRYIVSTEARVPSKDLAQELVNVCKRTGLGDPTAITYDSSFVGGAIPIGCREVEATERLATQLGVQLRSVTET
jgi:nucleoside-diphosphate-sugar epimerase